MTRADKILAVWYVNCRNQSMKNRRVCQKFLPSNAAKNLVGTPCERLSQIRTGYVDQRPSGSLVLGKTSASLRQLTERVYSGESLPPDE